MMSAKDEKKATATPDKSSTQPEAISPEEEAVKKLSRELRQAEAKRRLFRRTLNQYERIKKRFTTQLDKLTGAEAAADKSENPDKDIVVAVYRLLRNFCISYNTIDMADRNEDKQIFPAKFEAEIKSALCGNAAVIKAFAEALKAEKADESVKVLPEKVDVKSVKLLNDFLDKHEKTEILSKLEKELEALTKTIDGQREELKVKRADIVAKQPPKPKQEATTKKPKKEKQGGKDQGSTEDRFRDLIQEVGNRVQKIQLNKDDHNTYSDVQSEIDSFLSEAISDILNIK